MQRMPVTQADLEQIRKDARERVLARPFKKVTGKAVWDDVEHFEEESRDLAMNFEVSYEYTIDYGLCVLVMPDDEYEEETGLVPGEDHDQRPPLVPVGFADMEPDQLKVAERELDELNKSYYTVLGFYDGFGENFREAFPERYYQQLKEGRLKKYRHVKPIDYIMHLREKVPLDTNTIKRMKANLLRGWEEEELEAFGKRLEEERDDLARLSPPVNVSDQDLNQHYLEEMWKRTDIFDIHVMKKWTKRDEDEKTWEHSREFFEAKMKEIDDYIAEGGATENYANVNAVSEIQQKMEERERALREEHANAISEMEKRTADKFDKLTEAMLAMAKQREQEREGRRKRPKRGRRRRRRDDSDSESDSDSSSLDDDVSPPPCRRRRTNGKKGRPKKRAPAAAPVGPPPDAGFYVPGEAFVRGMKPKKGANEHYMQAFWAARLALLKKGTEDAILERIDGYDRLLAKIAKGDAPGKKKEDVEERKKEWLGKLAKKRAGE